MLPVAVLRDAAVRPLMGDLDDEVPPSQEIKTVRMRKVLTELGRRYHLDQSWLRITLG